MMKCYRYETERLIVDEWHTLSDSDWPQQDLPGVIQQILTAPVTAFLPPSWQGVYTESRAQQWISERDDEGVTLLVVEKAARSVTGFVIVFDAENSGHLRLGYILKESAWGKGLASEIVSGFVWWCRQHNIQSLTGGVKRGNIASRRILEKSGFRVLPETQDDEEQLFRLDFCLSDSS